MTPGGHLAANLNRYNEKDLLKLTCTDESALSEWSGLDQVPAWFWQEEEYRRNSWTRILCKDS